MEEWNTRPLSDFVDPDRSICYGIVQPGSAVTDGVPIVRVNNFVGGGIDTTNALKVDSLIEAKYRRSRLQGGELLITLVGSMGLSAIASEELRGWNVALAVGVVPLRPDADKRWINFVVHSKPAQNFIRMRANTTVQATLNLKDLAELPIPCPPDATRMEMSAILSSLDDKIELNRRMNETLEAMARAIFRDWFVTFGPTRAKMEGRAPYLAPDIWSLFPDRLDDEGKPEGWGFGTLGDVAHQVGESVKPEALDPGTPYIGLEHMPRKSIALTDWGGADKVTSGKLSFCKGDFLFGKLRPYFHKVGIAPVDGICSTDIVVLNARERKAAPFILTCISRDEFVAFTDRTSNGTKMPRTSWGRMERYGLCLPSEPALEAFNKCVEPMLDRIVANIHESRTLATTRDFLLPKLMSGEVRVKDAEKIAGEAI